VSERKPTTWQDVAIIGLVLAFAFGVILVVFA
jgi:predicted outer membrane lipoprotein